MKESLWVEANKPVSEKNKDPILTCLLCDQPCHANIWHHHMSRMNIALAKVRLETVIILEDIAKELLSTMETLGNKKIADKFREDMNEIANKLEDECKGRLATARITAMSKRWKYESEHNYRSSTFITSKCCEWGIISFNPQEATTEITSEGTIDLLHFGLFTKTTTTLVKEALEAVMDNLSNKRMAKEERDEYATRLWRLWGDFVAATKQRGIAIQNVTMAALIQIATKQGRAEKEAMKKLEAEEIKEEAKSNEALEVSQGDHHLRDAPRRKGESCEVHVGFGNTARCRKWNKISSNFCKRCTMYNKGASSKQSQDN